MPRARRGSARGVGGDRWTVTCSRSGGRRQVGVPGEDLPAGGMGLWLARQLCDHVAIRRDGHGVTVRLSTRWG